jgi:hypothetical protein
MSASAISMAIASLALAGWSAENEPFYGPLNWRDALLHVIGGGMGTLFWLAWAAGIIYAVLCRWVSKWAALLVLLAILGLTLNANVTLRYLGDRQARASSSQSP